MAAGWWAETFASITSRLGKLTASVGGTHSDQGAIAAAIGKSAAALTGAMLPAGSMAAQTKQLMAAIAGTQGQAATLAAALPSKMSVAVMAAEIQQGTFDAILQPLAVAIVGTQSQSSAIASSSKQLLAALVGSQAQSGAITAALRQPLAASIAAQEIEQGAWGSALPLPLAAAMTSTQTNGGAMGGGLLSPLGALQGVEAPQGQLVAAMPKLVANLTGAQTQTSMIAAALKATAAALSASASQSGNAAALLKQASAALAGAQSQAGSLAGALSQALATIAGTNDSNIASVIVGTPNYVNAASSVTIPAHAVGDLIIMFCYNPTTTTIPTTPSAGGTVPAWTTIDPSAANGNACVVAYAVASATNHTSGTWTFANQMIAVVIRNQAASPIGGHASGGSTATSGAVAPAITMSDTSGRSLLLHFFGRRTGSGFSSWNAPPAGYTQLVADASTGPGICLITKDSTTSDGAVTQGSNGSFNTGYRGATVEILD